MIIVNLISNPDFWFGVIRSTTPILFAAMAALIARRCGITNMAIEGIMLFGALFAVIGSAYSGNAWVGLLCSILSSVVLSLILAYFKLRMRADEIMVAIALNLLAVGGTIFLLYLFTGSKSTSSSLPSKIFPAISLPLVENVPFLGRVLSGHNILAYLAFASVLVMNYLLFRTPLGLRIRSVGGNEHSAASVGVSVEKTRFIAMSISGVLAGFAGAYMSMGYLTIFTQGMTAGRGYIALAASNVGGAAPVGTMFASILFGFFDQLGNQLQTSSFIPPEFIYMIPYLATIIMYSLFSYRKLTEKRRMQRTKAIKKASGEAETSKKWQRTV